MKPTDPPKRRKRKPRGLQPVTSSQKEKIVALHEMTFGTRRIAEKVGLGRKIVRNVLAELGLKENRPPKPQPPSESKLDPFKTQVLEKAKLGLTVTRILREIRHEGYRGGRTILADFIRKNTAAPVPKKKVWRRFETAPAEETQFDWSPYRLRLGPSERVVHAFGATLGYCRKSHVRFYLSESESSLLEAHALAFDDFEGVTKRCVYDRMATVVLGTIGQDRRPLWHPRFLQFAAYYGFEPYLCKPRDPDRKGKDERIFWYLERDFLRGSSFDSLDDLNNQVRFWLDHVANCRVHGTTRRVPDEVWEQERPFLIGLPESRYPTCDEELRRVGPDSVISVRGTPYTVPAKLAHQTVSVHLFSEHFEVCDARGAVAFSRKYVPDAEHGRLVIDPNHYESVRRRGPLPGGSVADLEQALLTRFPDIAELCAGIRRRMKSLAHVHLRALWRLADRYGDLAFEKAAAHAMRYRRFDALALRRILERDFPIPEPAPQSALTTAASLLLQLGDVDGGSLDDYAPLDAVTKIENPITDNGTAGPIPGADINPKNQEDHHDKEKQ